MRPGAVARSRKTLPRFVMPHLGKSGKRKQLYECALGATLFRIGSHAFALPSSRWLPVLSSRIARRVRKNRHAATKFSARTRVRTEGRAERKRNGSDREGKTSSRPTLQPGLRRIAPAGFQLQPSAS